MKTKSVYILFLIIAVLLGIAFYVSKNKVQPVEDVTAVRTKIVTPKGAQNTEVEADAEKVASGFNSENFDTFITLLPSETLINSITLDFNNDGYDDEVVTVRKSGSEVFTIIPGIYNPESADYERLESIPTNVSRVRTFSVSGMDITGDHKNALIYQGFADDENYVMQLFMWEPDEGNGHLVNIGDFSSDGTIFIQQVERSDSYELSLSKGESFSIWVYESEKVVDKEGKITTGQNQIQKEYKWNPVLKNYLLENEIKVTAGKLAANELSRIQDGTVETFAAFLDGLWYKTSNTDSSIRYIYFNFDALEIIQLNDTIQEVYEWGESKLRHNGIYLYTVNTDITNLQRRFDVLLTSVDEIKITIHDSIGLTISENSVWDGQYKKLSLQSTFDDSSTETKNPFLVEFEKDGEWATVDGMSKISLKNDLYSFSYDDRSESGIYSFMNIGNYQVVQFRPTSFDFMLNETYSLEFGTKTITETVKKKTVEKIVTDYDTIIFTPVKITPTDCFAADGKTYTFVRTVEASENQQ